MQSKWIKGWICAAAIAAMSAPAQAVVIDHGTYLSDTDSGMDWLDVTASLGRSHADVSTQFGAGGDFAGWRYASGLEFSTLIDHYTGTPADPNAWGWAYTQGTLLPLMNLLGNLEFVTPNSRTMRTAGITGDFVSGGPEPVYLVGFMWSSLPPDIISDERFLRGSFALDAMTNPEWGSFLVRSSIPTDVPEPASLALLTAGLGLLGLSRKARRSANR